MESFNFADILFTLIVLAITFAILGLVNRLQRRQKAVPEDPESAAKADEPGSAPGPGS